MLKKLSLYLNTVRHLKIRQILYQVYYRLKPLKNLDTFLTDLNGDIDFSFLNFEYKYVINDLATTDNTFNFLNVKKKFDPAIDWDFQEYGKLWNYNLQYFYYLHQDSLPDEKKISWLIDIGGWLKESRLKLEPYPVSLRIMNTIRYLSGKKNKNPIIIKDAYSQLNYLSNNIEHHLLGNHLLENAFALIMGGGFFKIKHWHEKAKQILYKELNEQVLNDGGHFELSPMYHQIIMFRMLELIDWYRNSEGPDTAFLMFIEEKAVKMLSWLNHITFDNGDIPHFNDSSEGVACTTKQLLQFADGLHLVYDKTHALSDSGYRKYTTSKYECVVDAGEIGPSYQPGHSHADALSFVLYANKTPLVVDTGTSTYQAGPRRDLERATSSHNTVVIEGRDQSEVWGGFRVGRRAKTKIIDEDEITLTADHDGYKKHFGVIHQRNFTFEQDRILINDKIIGNTKLMSQSLIHFYPGVNIKINADNLIIIDKIAFIEVSGFNKLELKKYRYATAFNKYREADCIVFDFHESLNLAIEFL